MDDEEWGKSTAVEAPQSMGARRSQRNVHRAEVKPGDLISGKYRVLRVLGMGSMGSVWAARNELTNRDFAVKFLLTELAKNKDALDRFFLEARACGQIRHPAIVDVYDMGQAEDGSPFLVMELLEGEGFDQRIARQGTMRPVDLCRYISIVARGLEEAHMRGLVHRDLKPGNIFFALDKNGEVFPKVLDFGISKETSAEDFDYVKTSTGTVLGSPAYMSPEQARGESDVDARCDLWSLGVIMYEALTGKLPFDAANYNALMVAIITTPHAPVRSIAPTVPEPLVAIIDELLAKDRQDRIRSAGELADRLERLYATMTQTPLTRPERMLSLPPPGAAGTTQNGWWKSRTNGRPPSRMSPLVMGLSAILLLGMGGTTVALLTRNGGPPVEALTRFGGAAGAVARRALSEQQRDVANAKAHALASAKSAVPSVASSSPAASVSASASAVAPPVTVAPPPGTGPASKGKDDPHGGVDNAGF